MLLTQAEWEARQKRTAGEGFGKSKSLESGSRGRGCGRGGGQGGRCGHGDHGKDSTGEGKHDKSHIQCFKCHRHGHYTNRCPDEKKDEEAHHAQTVEVEAPVLLAETEEPDLQDHTVQDIQKVQKVQKVILNEEKVDPQLYFSGDKVTTGEIWYLDNGASNHMTGDRLKFKEIDQTVTSKVRFGDGSSVEIQGKDSILF